jgi:hypothetical protein
MTDIDDPRFILGVCSTKLDAGLQKADQLLSVTDIYQFMQSEYGESDKALINRALDELWNRGRALEFKPGYYCSPENKKRVEAAEKKRAHLAALPGSMKKTRAEYEALPAAAQSEFFRNGGVLI